MKNTMTPDQIISKLRKEMAGTHTGNNLHQDFLDYINQNKIFKLKDVSISSIPQVVKGVGLNKDNIDDYAKKDLSNAPPIVLHKDGHIIDGNHRLLAFKAQGAQTIKAYVGEETKLDLKLIDKEISEARLFRTSRQFKNLTGRQVADLLYLTSLSIWMMAKDGKQEDFARAYAKQSTQYGPYVLFRTHATDLFLLAYQVNDPDNRNISLNNSFESKRFLNSLKFNNRQHWLMISKIARGNERNSEMSTFFLRLESQLKISHSRFKQWRRLISDWSNLKYSQRQMVVAAVIQEYRRYAKGSEMISPLSTMTKYKAYSISDKYKDEPSLARRVAGTAAGAVAGRYAGKKLAKATGKNVDKYKKYGTGLGAIAGYWASGRQRQK